MKFRSFILGAVLSAALFGLWRIALPTTAADAASGSTGFVAVDSKGKVIGPIVSVDDFSFATALIRYQGKAYPIGVFRSGYPQGGIYYTSSDCTGQPYALGGGNLFPTTTIAGANNTLYIESGASMQLTVNSFLNFSCQLDTFTSTFTPVSEVFNLNDKFVPPFTPIPAR